MFAVCFVNRQYRNRQKMRPNTCQENWNNSGFCASIQKSGEGINHDGKELKKKHIVVYWEKKVFAQEESIAKHTTFRTGGQICFDAQNQLRTERKRIARCCGNTMYTYMVVVGVAACVAEWQRQVVQSFNLPADAAYFHRRTEMTLDCGGCHCPKRRHR